MFKGVKVAADAPGAYVLRAGSATRKVAVSDALVTVQVRVRAAGAQRRRAAAPRAQAGAAAACCSC